MSDERSSASAVTGSDDYDDEYYQEGHLGPPYTYEEPHWQRFFGDIADALVAFFAPKTFYDAGCAKGFLVRAMAERGVDARGGDISRTAIEHAPAGLVKRLEIKDLTQPFKARYELISCIEVLEHMAPADARAAIANLCAATDLVLMASTSDDFAEPTHINVRPAAHWAQDFATHGFFRRTDIDASFVAPWAVIYARAQPTAVQVVGAYEALLAPLSLEVVAKRRALLEAQRERTEARLPVNAAMDRVIQERDQLAARVDSQGIADLESERLNRLAMADELIGARAELALLKIQAENSLVEASRESVRLREVLSGVEAELESARADMIHLERTLVEVRASITWRIGRAITLPVRVLKLPMRLARTAMRRVKRATAR
jgi:SAM-dependent methyltransferase